MPGSPHELNGNTQLGAEDNRGDDPVDLDELAREITIEVQKQLPDVIYRLLRSGFDPNDQLQLECSLSSRQSARPQHVRIAALDLDGTRTLPASIQTPLDDGPPPSFDQRRPSNARLLRRRSARLSPDRATTDITHSPKRRKATSGLRIGTGPVMESVSDALSRRMESDRRVFPQRKNPKRVNDSLSTQPSALDKFLSGVWESIYSGVRLDPTEVIAQWQALESSGQPKLLLDTDQELSHVHQTHAHSLFGRMNILTRKISQTSRTFRSLEVIVQAHWIQCFDDRVNELAQTISREKAKKQCLSEACADFSWSEKELRNKMAIWRGYHDIRCAGGWSALVFAGMGLYRFCKYRMFFTEALFSTLRAMRHRFEVAADTLHPRWRQLLGIIGESTEPRYTGHPHDWVVGASSNEALPLAQTYHQWDKDFQYTHLAQSIIDEEAWGLFDPRTVHNESPGQRHEALALADDMRTFKCPTCDALQSDDPKLNECSCFPHLYGTARAGSIPVQVFRTPNGRNNGLIACASFERGAGIGEFVGLVTSGLANMDVMVGQTPRATYQIWQGRQGNHTRFINHSCHPNSQYERFEWLGTQRIVLVSKGIEAGEEITVDYSDTYWKNLDKVCLCGHPRCRYKNRRIENTPNARAPPVSARIEDIQRASTAVSDTRVEETPNVDRMERERQ